MKREGYWRRDDFTQTQPVHNYQERIQTVAIKKEVSSSLNLHALQKSCVIRSYSFLDRKVEILSLSR